MGAGFKVAEVEEDRLCGRSGAPSAAAEVAARDTVPEVARHRVPFAVAGAVAAPRRMTEMFYTVDDDGILFWVELVAATPPAVACADVA